MTAVESVHFDNDTSQREHFRDPNTPTTPRPNVPNTPLTDSAAAERTMPAPSSDTTGVAGHTIEHTPNLQTSGNAPTESSSGGNQNLARNNTAHQDSWMRIDIDDSDNDQDGSDNDTENGEGGTSARKKKGQRFFCTGYPPCNLSFTRSEHLARHIRKHTGERPFQCHCSRRFSRLDNLRQHAQTVHVNEEIPTDSLAATGTRFQRQIRTDRVRPSGRPRTNTMSSTGSHGRGHSRNLSASSIGSTSSNFSTSTEARRRPPPLLMANDHSNRPNLGVDAPSTPPPYRGYTANSPGDMSTPTSAYSMTPGSPGYGSSMGSPSSSSSRLAGGFFGSRTPGRRLSVPTGASPFLQQSFGNPYPGQYPTSMAPPSASSSSNSSVFASPTTATFGYTPPYQVSPGEDWRRRTWHPSTYSGAAYNYARPATSGLSYSQTPDGPQPAFAQNATAAASQAPRLPGIESFDQVQHRPSTPPRRGPSPMQLDAPTQMIGAPVQASSSHPSTLAPEQRQNRVSWDPVQKVIYQGQNNAGSASREESSWSQRTIGEIHNAANRQGHGGNRSNMGVPSASSGHAPPQQQQIAREALQVETNSASRSNRRNGWYNGPVPPARTSPEGSSSSEGIKTPGTASAEINPVIVHSSGYLEPPHAALTADAHGNPCAISSSQISSFPAQRDGGAHRSFYTEDRRDGGDMGRLAALVAVATSEDKAAPTLR